MRAKFSPAITMEWLEARVVEQDGCWIWTGFCTEEGERPKATRNGKTILVRKAVWEMAHGRKFRRDRETGSTCSNKRCCHPKHIKAARFNATKATGPLSQVQRSRISATKRAQSKLPDVAAAALRTGELTDAQAADQYGVSKSLAFLIRSGRSRLDYANPFFQLAVS